ncbi:9548_t:CDS:2 [Funneliformis caledonium]|uniref:9548_t:CDS:1 n=1 Tax=Funneliformis caledonium TaxID=1117310 RepID=A0A9N8ZW05_9GLOM|nr:9548_t:CDS:2 [Funneliformis caledonium]
MTTCINVPTPKLSSESVEKLVLVHQMSSDTGNSSEMNTTDWNRLKNILTNR